MSSDSAATAPICFRRDYKNVRPLITHVPIALPDVVVIKYVHTWKLNLAHLPEEDILAYTVPNLQEHSVIFIQKLCAAGFQVLFTGSKCTVYHKNKIFL